MKSNIKNVHLEKSEIPICLHKDTTESKEIQLPKVRKPRTRKVEKADIQLPEVEEDVVTATDIDTRLYRAPRKSTTAKSKSKRNCENQSRDGTHNKSVDDEPDYVYDDVDEDADAGSDNTDDDEEYEDLSEMELSEEHLNAYEYVVDPESGIRLYNGVLVDTKQAITDNIALYKMLNPAIIFEPISSSTLTVKGLIRNLDFQNEAIISKMKIPTDQKVIKIGCNEEEIYIFPNDYVDYNIAHLLDILKNSKSTKYKTRIECNCQNLLDHADNILGQYEDIKTQISALKDSDIVKRIERYLMNQKNRNRSLLDKIIKVFKKIMGYVFHPYLFENSLDVAIGHLFDQLSRNVEFERNTQIKDLRELFEKVISLVSFFRAYIAKCRCIKQPYDAASKIPIKLVAEDTKKVSAKAAARPHKYIRRKTHGCGKYFSSQITFEIYSAETEKIYKIKIFRNGNFQAPGIKHKDMSDILMPLNTLTQYLRTHFGADIHISYIISVMRNYLSYIRMPTFESSIRDYNNKYKIIGTHLYLDKLDEKCRQEKTSLYMTPNEATAVLDTLKCVYRTHGIGNKLSISSNTHMVNNANVNADTDSFRLALRIYDYMHIATMKIAGISNNTEKSGGLLLKFDRPIPDKPNKKMTIKIMATGKFNFDGCNSELEVWEVYYWLHNIFRRHMDDVVFNRKRLSSIIPSDDDGYDSLYDN